MYVRMYVCKCKLITLEQHLFNVFNAVLHFSGWNYSEKEFLIKTKMISFNCLVVVTKLTGLNLCTVTLLSMGNQRHRYTDLWYSIPFLTSNINSVAKNTLGATEVFFRDLIFGR